MPLVGLTAYFHYTRWLPEFVTESTWALAAMDRARSYLRRKGLVQDHDDAAANGDEAEGEGKKETKTKKGKVAEKFAAWRKERKEKAGLDAAAVDGDEAEGEGKKRKRWETGEKFAAWRKEKKEKATQAVGKWFGRVDFGSRLVME